MPRLTIHLPQDIIDELDPAMGLSEAIADAILTSDRVTGKGRGDKAAKFYRSRDNAKPRGKK
jgi:hypothetical protein